MDTLYKDWLSCMSGGVRPVLGASATQCFYKSLEAAYTMAFEPMLVEARGFKANLGGVEEYVPIWSLEDWNIDYDTGLQWSYGVNRWLKLSQMADYANHCLSGYVDSGTRAFLNTIGIWKGLGNLEEPYTLLADDNCPMNSQWLPQAIRLGTVYTDLSSLEGTDMQPWWSTSYNPAYFGDPSFDGLRYTVYNGPYLPSKMNRQWYCASWRALCKLINTPSIAIGGSQYGWRWLNPLYRSTNSVCFNLSSFQDQAVTNQFIPLSSFIDYFDSQVCGGNGIRQDTLPWSVCGLIVGDAVYSSDNAAWTRGSVYFNLPILEPLDGMRAFFGASRTFAQEHVGIQNMEYKLPHSFLNRWQFGEWTNILSTGTDVEHWGGSNPTGRWPEYSFVAKPFRTAQNTLTEVCLQDDLKGNICTPPLRLVAENMFAHQWLWNSFLFGAKTDRWTNKLDYTYAWSPLRFTREHYFRDYSFNVYGEAHLSTDNGTDWVMVIDQDWNTTSRSNYQWRPLEEFAAYEPVLAHLEPNTLKYNADHTYGENVIHGNPYPQGTSQICCVFEIPLPLSVDGPTAVFDATYLSSSGYTRAEWNEIVRIAKSMFPASGQWKRDKELEELQQEFDWQYESLSSQLEDCYDALSSIDEHEASMSVDCWVYCWGTAVNNVYPNDEHDIGGWPWDKYNEGISATSAWTGADPLPFENFMSCWAGTQWDLHGYFYNGSSYPGFGDFGSFEYAPRDNLNTYDWTADAYGIYDNLADDIAQSKVIKDGQTSAYYSAERIQDIRDTLSGWVDDIKQNGYSALQASGSLIQALQNQYPPITCTVTTDPQTSAEISTYVQDENAWKRVVIAMNNNLADYTQHWYWDTRSHLENATPPWQFDWDESQKWQYINALSAVLDPVMNQAWADEYEECLSAEAEYWIRERQQVSALINDFNDQISALSAWYDEEYERIMQIEDDPLPTPRDLKKFLHYDITGRATNLSTDWSTSMTMFAICPDTDSEQLSDYPYWDYKWLQMDYMCDCPTTRWPYARYVPTKYMVGIKKTALEEVSSNGTTQLSNVTKGRTWVHDQPYSYGSSQFDSFRYDLMGYMEAGIAGSYFGLPDARPQPHQFFGGEVQDPGRWTIHDVLSVDTGTYSEGIEKVEYDIYNMNVRFVNNGYPEEWECRKIWVYCINGPVVYTDDCWYRSQKRWQQMSTVPWKFAEGQSVPEYYNRPPSADVDFSLPELSGSIEVNASEQVLGEFDTTYFMQYESGF